MHDLLTLAFGYGASAGGGCVRAARAHQTLGPRVAGAPPRGEGAEPAAGAGGTAGAR